MNEAIMELIMAILAAVATGAISIAVAFFQSKVKSQKTHEALGRLSGATAATVNELQQTIVDGWKEAGGGKLTSGQVEILKRAAKTKIFDKMDEPAVALLGAMGVDIDALIAGFVEDAVRKIKLSSRWPWLPVSCTENNGSSM